MRSTSRSDGRWTAGLLPLLRGINVGPNRVPMALLPSAFEDDGYGSVSTYLQSGNVLLSTDGPVNALEASVEALMERRPREPREGAG